MGSGICPECGSSNVGKESGRWGHTGDWICYECKCSGYPDSFVPKHNCGENDKQQTEKDNQ